MDNPNQQGVDLFEKASNAVFELEQFLRKREQTNDACRPLYRMRIGLHEMFNHYMANRTVCDRETIYEMLLHRK
jgi:hypothetical protein